MDIGGILEREANRLLLPHQLNQQQFSILFEIARVGEVQQKDMINRLHLEKAHVSKVTRKLHEMGVIAIRPHETDKRSTWLKASPKGLALVQECQRLFKDQKQEWFQSVPTAELAQLLLGVEALQTVLSRKRPQQRHVPPPA